MFEFPFGVSFLRTTEMFCVPALSDVGNRRLNCFSGAAYPGNANNPKTTVATTTEINAFRVRLTRFPPCNGNDPAPEGAQVPQR